MPTVLGSSVPVIGKTIQIYLPDGKPRGVKIAEITSRTVQVIVVPRSELELAAKRPELCAVGIYFLVGADETVAEQKVYVGEAEDCLARLRQHQKNKDFWQVAVIVTSKTQYFTKAHVKYLEWYCHSLIDRAGRFQLENGNMPPRPFIPEAVQADLADNFESIQVLVSALGYPLFDEIRKPERADLLICKGKGAQATGEYTEDGLVVLAGSTANREETKSAVGGWVTRIRLPLIESAVLVPQGELYRFARNYVFPSPSSAAVAVLGRNANGWTEWRYEDGRTLDEVHRQTEL
jgi:hypothetical protein